MSSGRLSRITVAALVAVLISMLATPPVWSASPASWAGRVFHGDGVTPRAGVVVSLVDADGQRAVQALPTRADGGFVIDKVPAGSYALAVETDEGAFVSSGLVALQPGINPPMGLALRSGPINAELPYGLGNPGGLSKMGGWLLAGGIFFLSIFALHEISDTDSQKNATIVEPEGEENPMN